MTSRFVSLSSRVMVTGTAVIGTLWVRAHHAQTEFSDFGWAWRGARELVAGHHPYHLIGPGRTFDLRTPLWYPLPALVLSAPLAWLSLPAANTVFLGLSTALLAWVLTRESVLSPKLLLFGSWIWLNVIEVVQWSPLLTAAALIPFLGVLLACKPTIGLALLTAYPSRPALLGCVAITLVTIALWPWWISEWLGEIRTSTATAPAFTWAGSLVLLALLKWRRAEARLLVGLAVIPHHSLLYDLVPLFLVVDNWLEGLILVVLTRVVYWGINVTAAEYASVPAWLAAAEQWAIWCLYLPCVAMVLRRPNIWPQPTTRGVQ